MPRFLIENGKMVQIEDAPTLYVPSAKARTIELDGRTITLNEDPVDLAANMRRRYGIAEPQAVAPGQMLAANMRARHGIADHQPQAKAAPGAPKFDIVADMKRRHGIID